MLLIAGSWKCSAGAEDDALRLDLERIICERKRRVKVEEMGETNLRKGRRESRRLLEMELGVCKLKSEQISRRWYHFGVGFVAKLSV